MTRHPSLPSRFARALGGVVLYVHLCAKRLAAREAPRHYPA